jgi:thioredoxin reductase (NADPH)
MQYPLRPARRLFDATPLAPRDLAALAPPSPRASKPVILAVDDEAESLREVSRELHRRYGGDYRVVCEPSGEAGMERLREFEKEGDDVALVLADEWLPGMSGTEFLTRVREVHPRAGRALMVARYDRTAPAPILRAMSLGRMDYYVNKPWGGGDERFHKVVSDFLYEWAKDHRPKFEEIRVVGEQWSPRSHELRDLLGRNGILYTFHSSTSREGRELLETTGRSPKDLPVVVLFDGQVLEDPTNADIAEACGANPDLDRSDFDLVIIGAGPAGLAAAVYGASEGLDTLVVEGEAIGGQAGTSSLIRNYLGFPQGVGGAELAKRAAEQAWLFGATFLHMLHATSLRRAGDRVGVMLSCGNEMTAKSVIIATGASYRRLDVSSLEELHGAGVFYGAAVAEARAMAGKEVYVVGAGNSAGQAAMHLSKYASRVTIVARANSLASSMSDYLIKEIEATDNVAVRVNTRVTDGGGHGRLEHLTLESPGSVETVPAAGLFVLIGAEPRTGWLPEEIKRDEGGYVVTGNDLGRYGLPRRRWHIGRLPLHLETSMRGVFAVGDVRHGSVNRVASAVGEGAVAVTMVHEYLASIQKPSPSATAVPATV